MSSSRQYNGGLTREQFLYYEVKVVAGSLCDGMNREEALAEIQSHNLFQFPTERMIASIFHTCLKRIDALESDALVYHLAKGTVEIGKQINLYAMMKSNGIVWDFMVDVIGEKFRTQQLDFSRKDLNVFFMELSNRIPTVASWSDSTISKIKQVLTKMLVECGYLDNVKSAQLNHVYLFPELEEGIRENQDFEALASFNSFM